MASLGRLREVILDTAGNAISSVSVEVRRQGATVVSGSGTTPVTITVNNPGAVVAGDTVVINTGTTTFDVDSVTATTVVLSGFLLTLTLSDEDRISPTNNLAALKNDAEAGETKTNPLTTDSTGTVDCWVVGNAYDLLVSGGGATTTLVQDRYVSGRSISANTHDTINQSNYLFDTTDDLDAVSGSGNATALQAIHTEWLDKGARIMTLHGLDQSVMFRVGGRAQVTVVDEIMIGYFSETYTADLASGQETSAVFGLTQIAGDIASGANSVAVTGETQWNPSVAKTATGSFGGIGGIGRYAATNAGSTAAIVRGGEFSVRVSAGAVGTISNFRSLEAAQPINDGTATITNAISFLCLGPASAIGATQNFSALFTCPNDEDADFIITKCPIRISDGANSSNSGAADGRWVDIYRTWDGDTDTGSLFVNMHLTTNYTGTFSAGEDGMGLRLFTTTGTAANDATDLDELVGIQSIVSHRSDQNIDDMIGVDVIMTETGTGEVAKTAGIRIGAPPQLDADHAAAAHIRFIPFSTANPQTDTSALTAPQRGDFIFIHDTDDNANSGPAFFDGSTWVHITIGGVAAISNT